VEMPPGRPSLVSDWRPPCRSNARSEATPMTDLRRLSVREERQHREGVIARERKSEKRESIVSREEEATGAARLPMLLPCRAARPRSHWSLPNRATAGSCPRRAVRVPGWSRIRAGRRLTAPRWGGAALALVAARTSRTGP